MKNICEDFNRRYTPFKALLIYQATPSDNDYTGDNEQDRQIYVESYDIGKQGFPVNAHPLSVAEMVNLGELLQTTQELQTNHFKSTGILPNKVLYINPHNSGFAVWYTPPQERDLFFVEGLNIPCGKAKIPAMIWKATKDSLNVYAIKGKSKPTEKTPLYHAPYFNVYDSGNVCMGTVRVDIDRFTTLDVLMDKWEAYFFNSYFSHTIGNHTGCNMELKQLWRQQVETDREFPGEVLVKHSNTLKQLMR